MDLQENPTLIVAAIMIIIIMILGYFALFTGPSSSSSNSSPAAQKVYQRPTIKDTGYNNAAKGWYDAEGLGGCYNYCRNVGNDGSWFSCMEADKTGGINSPNVYSAKGLYTPESLASKRCAA